MNLQLYKTKLHKLLHFLMKIAFVTVINTLTVLRNIAHSADFDVYTIAKFDQLKRKTVRFRCISRL